MIGSALSCILFAQIANWQRMGDGLYRSRGRVDLTEFLSCVLGLAAIAIVIAIVLKIRKRNDMTEHCDDPKKLFRELSLAHNLDRTSQKLLWQLAEALQLAQPAEVFLQPSYYHADRVPPELFGKQAELQALQERLF